MSIVLFPRGGFHLPASDPASSQNRLTLSRVTSYHAHGVKFKQPRRARYPNLSPTRCPSIAADIALWPAWTEQRVGDIDYKRFGDDGESLATAAMKGGA